MNTRKILTTGAIAITIITFALMIFVLSLDKTGWGVIAFMVAPLIMPPALISALLPNVAVWSPLWQCAIFALVFLELLASFLLSYVGNQRTLVLSFVQAIPSMLLWLVFFGVVLPVLAVGIDVYL